MAVELAQAPTGEKSFASFFKKEALPVHQLAPSISVGIQRVITRNVHSTFSFNQRLEMMQSAKLLCAGEDYFSGRSIETVQHVIPLGANNPNNRILCAVSSGEDW